MSDFTTGGAAAALSGFLSEATDYFVSLHDGDPGVDGSANELSGGGYARQAVQFTLTANQAASDAVVSFGANSSGANRTVTHVGVWDQTTGGTCLFLEVPQEGDRIWQTASPFDIPAGFTFTLDVRVP